MTYYHIKAFSPKGTSRKILDEYKLRIKEHNRRTDTFNQSLRCFLSDKSGVEVSNISYNSSSIKADKILLSFDATGETAKDFAGKLSPDLTDIKIETIQQNKAVQTRVTCTLLPLTPQAKRVIDLYNAIGKTPSLHDYRQLNGSNSTIIIHDENARGEDLLVYLYPESMEPGKRRRPYGDAVEYYIPTDIRKRYSCFLSPENRTGLESWGPKLMASLRRFKSRLIPPSLQAPGL